MDMDQDRMMLTSPAAKTRQCSSCGKTLSLNFFALDNRECRRCEAQRSSQLQNTLQELA